MTMRAKLVPLSDQDRAVAAEHAGTVFRFLRANGLDDDWYDIVIFRYLLSAQKWVKCPDLHRYKFSTIAWRAMSSAVDNEHKKRKRRKNILQTLSLDEPISGTEDLVLADTLAER